MFFGTGFIAANGCFFYFKETLSGINPSDSTHKGYKFGT